MKPIRMCLSGSQSTGKTTVLNLFKEAGHPVITEVVRNLVKTKGISINQQGTDETQRMVFNEYKRVLSQPGPWISDRGLSDVISYTASGVFGGKVGKDVLDEQKIELELFVNDNPDIVYVYFPIEFPVVDDGVRSTNEKYRNEIDCLIHDTLDAMGVRYLTVHGTPEERFKQICDFTRLKFESD